MFVILASTPVTEFAVVLLAKAMGRIIWTRIYDQELKTGQSKHLYTYVLKIILKECSRTWLRSVVLMYSAILSTLLVSPASDKTGCLLWYQHTFLRKQNSAMNTTYLWHRFEIAFIVQSLNNSIDAKSTAEASMWQQWAMKLRATLFEHSLNSNISVRLRRCVLSLQREKAVSLVRLCTFL